MYNIEERIGNVLPQRMGPMFGAGAAVLNYEQMYDVKPNPNPYAESPAYLMMNGSRNGTAVTHPTTHLRAENEGYCRWLVRLVKTNRLFFFYEFLSGNMLKHFLRSHHLGCLAGDGIVEPAVECLQDCITPKGLPLALRPFLTGGFLLMILFFWLDLVYLRDYTRTEPMSDAGETWVVASCFITICLYIVCGVKCSGSVNTYGLQQRSRDIIRTKSYLREGERYCNVCYMIRPLRSVHCEKCGVCVTKYSKHSIFLNRCIGAGNELLYMVLQLAIIITVLVILNVFVFETLKGWLAFKILFYFINAHLQLQCIIDALELLIYSTFYNCTEYELEHWKDLDYLHVRGDFFVNPNDIVRSCITKGFWKNLKEELIGMTCGGQFEPRQLSFQYIAREGQQKRVINWNRSLMFHPAHLPNHPNRVELATIANGEYLKILYEEPVALIAVQEPKETTPPRSQRGRRYKASSLHSTQTDKSRMASTEVLVNNRGLDNEGERKSRLALTATYPHPADRFRYVQMVEESPQFDLE